MAGLNRTVFVRLRERALHWARLTGKRPNLSPDNAVIGH